MSKVKIKDEKSLEEAKEKSRGTVDFRKTKDGAIAARSKWPIKRKSLKIQNRKCLCDNSTCAKCLSINCQDKNCKVHTKEGKEIWRRRWEEANKKSFPHPKNY